MKYSKYQIDIFNWVKNSSGNLVIDATAGSGKTSTLKEICKIIPNNKRVLLLAFNVAIVKELQEKINGDNISIMTTHGLGYRYLKTHFKYSKDYHPELEIDEYKYKSFFKKNFSELTEHIEFKSKIEVELFKENILGVLDLCRVNLCSNIEQVADICEKYDYDLSSDGHRLIRDLITFGLNKLDTIDFCDMITLPHYLDISPSSLRWDWVLADESQDMNSAQIDLINRCGKKNNGTRFVYVGDKIQCINSFAGSSSDVFDKLKESENTISLPLTISYRCPQVIRDFVLKYEPRFEVRDNALIGSINYNVKVEEIKDNSMVLCRSNSPILKLFLQLIKSGRKCYLKGGETIGKELLNIINKTDQQFIEYNLNNHGLIPELYNNLFQVRNRVRENLQLDIEDATSHPSVLRQYELINSIKALSGGITNVFELKHRVERLFNNDKENGICLSTCHRSKGLENDHVYVLCPSLLPSKLAKKEWEKESEKCLEFVTFTRCKQSLNFICEKDFPVPGENSNINMIISHLNRVEPIIYNIYNQPETNDIEQIPNDTLYQIDNDTIEESKQEKLKIVGEQQTQTLRDYRKKKERFAKIMIGETIENVYDIFNDLGLNNSIRVVMEDGVGPKTNADYQNDRINVSIENNKIKEIYGFG